MEDITSKLDFLIDQALLYAPKILLALLVLFIGLRIIRWVGKLIDKSLTKKIEDPSVRKFVMSLVSILLKVLLFLSVAELVGVKTASFIAIFAAAGFAIGMALQGSLGNFASGVMIMIFKPYKVGDIVQIAGSTGEVVAIEIFNTILRNPLNETFIVANSNALGDTITNYSTVGNRRVDLFFHIPYEQDFAQVRTILMEFINNHELILKEPAASVDIEAYDSHNVQIGVFVFCKPADYWTVFYGLNNAIKPLLGKHGIKVAYSEGVELGMISSN